MKTLADGSEVVARSYYYMLDWNEQDEWTAITKNYGTNKLCLLNLTQYRELFMYATMHEPTIFKY